MVELTFLIEVQRTDLFLKHPNNLKYTFEWLIVQKIFRFALEFANQTL